MTGSRLARDSFNVSTPLVSVDNQMLQDAGLGSVAQILIDEVPSLFESSSNMFNNDPFVPRTGDNYETGIGNYDSKFGGGVGRFYFVGAEMQFGG